MVAIVGTIQVGTNPYFAAAQDTLTIEATGRLVPGTGSTAYASLQTAAGTIVVNLGEIQGNIRGIYMAEAGQIRNYGLISGTNSWAGIQVNNGAAITNDKLGVISGGAFGLRFLVQNSAIHTVQNEGVISGGTAIGIDPASSGTSVLISIINVGTIRTTGAYSIDLSHAETITLNNTGTIDGNMNFSASEAITVSNSGIIRGSVGFGASAVGVTFRATENGQVTGWVTGSGHKDLLQGAGQRDRLNGLGGDDRLLGGDNFDRLEGGAGFDGLIGGRGADSLYGGAGGDHFIFQSIADSRPGSGVDRIYDFQHNADMINLRALPGKGHFIGAKAFSHSGHFEVRSVYDRAHSKAMVYIDVNGDGRLDMSISAINMSAPFHANDFVL